MQGSQAESRTGGRPGATNVTVVAPYRRLVCEYVAFGLPAGRHNYKVAGVNDGGVGPLSDPAGVSVDQAQAA